MRAPFDVLFQVYRRDAFGVPVLVSPAVYAGRVVPQHRIFPLPYPLSLRGNWLTTNHVLQGGSFDYVSGREWRYNLEVADLVQVVGGSEPMYTVLLTLAYNPAMGGPYYQSWLGPDFL